MELKLKVAENLYVKGGNTDETASSIFKLITAS